MSMNLQCEHKHGHEQAVPAKGRRNFLRLAALGGGVSLLAAITVLPEARAAGHTEALLLSCMDFRLMNEIESYMIRRGLRDSYDHVVLAGASLGAVTDKFPAWNQIFWDHLDIAIQRHDIQKVIVMDHRDCGAYKAILGPKHAKDRKTETGSHAAQLGKLKAMIKEKHPKLEVEMLLMALDGKVETLV